MSNPFAEAATAAARTVRDGARSVVASFTSDEPAPAPPDVSPSLNLPDVAVIDALVQRVTDLRTSILTRADARFDPRDLPGTMTQRQREAYQLGTDTLRRLTSACLFKLNELAADRSVIVHYGKPYQRLVDARAKLQAMPSGDDVTLALLAVDDGPQPRYGMPDALPKLLNDLLSETCLMCGHVDVAWAFPLPILTDKLEHAAAHVSQTEAFCASVEREAATVAD